METTLETARFLGFIVGLLGFALMAYRLTSTWPDLTVLTHGLALIVTGLSGFGGLGMAYLMRANAPVNPFSIPILVLLVGTVVVAVFWPRWVDRRSSPFRRTPRH